MSEWRVPGRGRGEVEGKRGYEGWDGPGLYSTLPSYNSSAPPPTPPSQQPAQLSLHFPAVDKTVILNEP